jgi:hypothetical protein
MHISTLRADCGPSLQVRSSSERLQRADIQVGIPFSLVRKGWTTNESIP